MGWKTLRLRRFKTGSPILLLAFVACVVSFQNCQPLTPSSSAVQSELAAQAQFQADQQTISNVLGSNALVVWNSALNSGVVTSQSMVSSVPGQLSSILALTNSGTGPTLVTSSLLGMPIMNFTASAELSPQSTTGFTANAFTIIALFQGPLFGTLMTINESQLEEELDLVATSSTLAANHYTDGNDYEALSTTTSTNSSGIMVVASSYGTSLGSVNLMVNGSLVQSAMTTTGNPTANAVAARNITIGSGNGSFQLGEVMVILNSITPAQLNTMSRYIASRWNFGGVIYDPTLQ